MIEQKHLEGFVIIGDSENEDKKWDIKLPSQIATRKKLMDVFENEEDAKIVAGLYIKTHGGIFHVKKYKII